jgi:hypothetical protein
MTTDAEFDAMVAAEFRKLVPMVKSSIKKSDVQHTLAYTFAISLTLLRAHKEARGALEKRVAELEAKSIERAYQGIWRTADAYEAGQLATHDGSLWLAKQPSCGVRPGTSSKWVLIVKRGKDAR